MKVFQLFQFSFFLIKIQNLCEGHVSFWNIEHQLQENVVCISIAVFYEIFIKLICVFNPL